MLKSKKGAYFFVLDVILGILVFATTVFLISGFATFNISSDAINQQLDLVATDVFETEMRYTDITNDFIFQMKQNSKLYDPFYTIDEYVYILVLNGQIQNATWLVGNTTSWLSSVYGINYSIYDGSNNIPIYYKNSTITTHDESRSRLAREKVTLLGSNITHYRPPVFSSVVIWR